MLKKLLLAALLAVPLTAGAVTNVTRPAAYNNIEDGEVLTEAFLDSNFNVIYNYIPDSLFTGHTFIWAAAGDTIGSNGVIYNTGITYSDSLTVDGVVNFNGATVSDLGTITTADIDGGTIDGATITGGTIENAVIGGVTPAAGTFTTGTFVNIITSGTSSVFGNATANGSETIAVYDAALGPRVGLMSYNITDAQSGQLYFYKSSSATPNTEAETVDGEVLGEIGFYGVNTGLAFDEAARIRVTQTGSAGASSVPAIMMFSIDGGGLFNSMQIGNGSDQGVYISDTNPFVIGATTQVSDVGGEPEFQIQGTLPDDSAMLIGRWSADAEAPRIYSVKGRGGIGDATTVADNDSLLVIAAWAEDGTTNPVISAKIDFLVDDASPANGTVGSEMIFSVTTDGGALGEAFRVKNDKRIYVADGGGLVVGNSATTAAWGTTPEVQFHGTGGTADRFVSINSWSTTASAGGALIFSRSGSNSIGTYGTVVVDDNLGDILWVGADGTDAAQSVANIQVQAEGTIAGNRVPGRMVFKTAADAAGSAMAEVFRIDSSQNIIVADGNGMVIGHTAFLSNGETPEFQIIGTGGTDGDMQLVTFSTTNSPTIHFARSRGASIGSYTALNDNDLLGALIFYGSDGTDINMDGAKIHAEVNGTPASNWMPTELVFSVEAGATGVTEAGRFLTDLSLQVAHDIKLPAAGAELRFGSGPDSKIYDGSDEMLFANAGNGYRFLDGPIETYGQDIKIQGNGIQALHFLNLSATETYWSIRNRTDLTGDLDNRMEIYGSAVTPTSSGSLAIQQNLFTTFASSEAADDGEYPFYVNTSGNQQESAVAYFLGDHASSDYGDPTVGGEGGVVAIKNDGAAGSAALATYTSTEGVQSENHYSIASTTGNEQRLAQYKGGITSIADDATATILTTGMTAYGHFSLKSGNSGAVALITFSTGASPSGTISTQAGSWTIATTTADVTGTTGSDGNVTISFRNGALEVENRSGVVIGVGWVINRL